MRCVNSLAVIGMGVSCWFRVGRSTFLIKHVVLIKQVVSIITGVWGLRSRVRILSTW